MHHSTTPPTAYPEHSENAIAKDAVTIEPALRITATHFEQAFKIGKLQYHDIWAGILVCKSQRLVSSRLN